MSGHHLDDRGWKHTHMGHTEDLPDGGQHRMCTHCANHSAVLAALVKKGRVERRSRGSDRSRRGSYVYRLMAVPSADPGTEQ